MVQPQNSHRQPMRSVLEAYASVTRAADTAKAGDHMIGVNRAGVVTVTFPAAEVRKGRVYTVKDESGAAANNITIATEGSETNDGSATDTIRINYGAKTHYSDGADWFTVPIQGASSVTHASTTGQGTGDHHAQAHQADHNNGRV